jgi:hypothetical protein
VKLRRNRRIASRHLEAIVFFGLRHPTRTAVDRDFVGLKEHPDVEVIELDPALQFLIYQHCTFRTCTTTIPIGLRLQPTGLTDAMFTSTLAGMIRQTRGIFRALPKAGSRDRC